MGNDDLTSGDLKNKERMNWLLIIGVILIGANLRAPITSVGSLISFIRDDLGISATLAGSITTLPLLAFALFSPFAPKIANRIGMEWTIFISLILLSVGIILRSVTGIGFLFFGTVLIGLTIAIGNVLLPGFIKMNFPLKIGIMTGIYAVSMNIFGALASGLSVPFSTIPGFGWQGSLGLWSGLTLITLLIWIPQLRRPKEAVRVSKPVQTLSTNVWRSKLAWYITVFMGLQSLIFYTLITWLPEILQLHEFSSSSAGWMLFLLQFSIIPTTFVIPLIAEKMNNQKLLSGITGLLFIIGLACILVGNQMLIYVAVIIIGVANGSSFSLSMMFFSLRTKDGQQAAEVSGMAQSFGYLLAALGPVLFGALHDKVDSWTLPLVMLIVMSVILLIAGVESGKDRMISSEIEEKEVV